MRPIPKLGSRGDRSAVTPSVLVSLLVLAPTPAALADEPVEPATTVRDEVLVEEELPYFSEETSTATRTVTPIQDLALSATNLSRTYLQDRNALRLGEALDTVVGINAQTNAGVHEQFFVRGFDSLSGSLILADGVAEPEATFYQMYNVDRVEVVRGPAGFLYGGDALASTINLVRKRPATGRFVTLGAAAGSHSLAETTLDANWGRDDGRAGFRLNGLWRQSDGWRDQQESRVFSVNPVGTFLAGERTIVTISAEALQSDFEPDSGIPVVGGRIADVDRSNSYQTPYDYSDQSLFRFRLDVESRLSDRLSLRNRTYVNKLDWETKGTLINGVFDAPTFGTQVFRSRTILDDSQEFVGNQFDAVWDLGSGSVRHQLVVGLEVARRTDDFTLDVGLLPTIGLDDPFETAPEKDQLLPGFGIAAEAETTIVAPYVLDAISIGDRWNLYVGGRFDSIDYEDASVGLDISDDQFSPFAGISFAATDDLSVYASYAESFAPPSTTVAADGRAPEEGRQTEIGFKHDFGDGLLRTRVAAYRLEKDNIAIVDATGVLAQAGDQQSEGVELELTGSPRPGLNWLFSWAWTDAELVRFTEAVQVPFPPFVVIQDHSGNTPAFAPENLVSFWVHQRFDSGLGLSGGGRWVDDQFIDEDNAFALDSYVVFDATVSWRAEAWEALLHLKNLGDEEYFGRGFGNVSVLPADGFHWMTALKWTF